MPVKTKKAKKTTKAKAVKKGAKKASKKSSTKSTSKKGAKKTALIQSNIKFYKSQLEELQADLSSVIQKKREEVWPDAEVGDEADVAVQSVARDLVFELSGNERHILEEVEAALRRIEKNVYGVCESCGDVIGIARLKAVPYARYCIKCQSRFEHS